MRKPLHIPQMQDSMYTRELSFKNAILEAQDICLGTFPGCFLIGEGVGDPKQVFGTTLGLKDKFPDRVFDMPISENAGTGICIGSAINGLKPILVHQRMDFSLYAADQVINNAAKWFSMYGGQKSVPLVIRMIIGRGWGQGNQHSQNLTALYNHIPGLKIVMPSSAYDAKGLFISAVKDPNPVLFIEHRWLYETTSNVPEGVYSVPIGAAANHIKGSEVTVVASGYAMREAYKATGFLRQSGVLVDLIDLRTIKPLPISAIISSCAQTKRLVVVDDAWKTGGLAGEIIAQVVEQVNLESRPVRVTYPDYPSASSPGLTQDYYNGPYDICVAVERVLGRMLDLSAIKEYQTARTHDVPDKNFKGPF